MEERTRKERFLSSLERCRCDEKFIESFYDRFLSSSEEIRDKFTNTDFKNQYQMLLRSLEIAADATLGDPTALSEMRDRAETHNRHNLNIEPRFYATWLESVVDTAAEFDPVWNDEIRIAWESILGFAVKHMIKSY